MIDFKDQAVIVTGAGRGIGRLFALDIAKRGGMVVVNDLGGGFSGGGVDGSVAQQVVDEIVAAGGTAVASTHTVSTSEGGAGIVQTALDTFDRLDAVIHNAGITDNIPFEALTAKQWQDMIEINLSGGFYVAQPAFKAMKAGGYGRFVFMGSSSGMLGVIMQAHYASAKAGLFGLKNAVAVEGAPHGILANYVMPMARTRMIDEAFAAAPHMLDMPLFKLMKPDLVTPMVVYLASKACTVSHDNFSAGAGRFARLFAGIGPGWFAGELGQPTADDIAAHFAEVSATDPYYVPSSVMDESVEICGRHGIEMVVPDQMFESGL